jgi:hypothetical protein
LEFSGGYVDFETAFLGFGIGFHGNGHGSFLGFGIGFHGNGHGSFFG